MMLTERFNKKTYSNTVLYVIHLAGICFIISLFDLIHVLTCQRIIKALLKSQYFAYLWTFMISQNQRKEIKIMNSYQIQA